MRFRFATHALAAAILFAAAPVIAQIRSAQPPAPPAIGDDLGLLDFTVQALVIPDAAGDSFTVTLTLGGKERTLALDPWSYAAPNARVQIDDGSGTLKDIELPESRTYRGFDAEGPSLTAAGSLLDNGLTLTIIDLATDAAWHVQPLRDVVPGADRALHVVYDAADVLDLGLYQCGGAIPTGHGEIADVPADGNGGTRQFLVCEIAVDGDYQFFQQNGSNEQNTINDINNVMAGVALSYETYLGVTYQITHYIIRTTQGSNPYTTNNPSSLLSQFQSWWNSNAGSVHRDVAHLFTGRNLDGSVIGIAYLSVICNKSQGYGLSQSRFTSNMNSRIALTAHEIGHNFSAPHCDSSPPCHVMCSGLGGCNGLGNPPRFGAASINKIVPYAQSRSCLDEGQGSNPAPPILEQFPGTTLDTNLWDSNTGVVNADGVNEPSAPYSLNLDSTDAAETQDINMTVASAQPYVTLFAQHRGVEAGKTLKVQYRDFFQNWTDLVTFTSDGDDRDYYSWSITPIPVLGWHEAFRVRISAQGADGTDDWYVDDLYIGEHRGLEVPFLESVPASPLRDYVWKTLSNASASSDGVNPPTGPYSMKITGAGSAETHNWLLATAPSTTHVSCYVQHRGVENGKQLVLEYLDLFQAWITLETFTSNGTDQNSFTFFQAPLNYFGAYHDNFAIRFRALGADASDAWYVDNLFVGPALTPPGDDCPADFNGDTVINSLDVLAFLNAYNANDPSADFNGDTVINSLDVLAFLNAYNAGCD